MGGLEGGRAKRAPLAWAPDLEHHGRLGCEAGKDPAKSRTRGVGQTWFQVRLPYVLVLLKVLDLSTLQFC